MKKSEVIKLMKEGYTVYVNCEGKKDLLNSIFRDLGHGTGFIKEGLCYVLKDSLPAFIECFEFKHTEKMINLSEIEPDNEKPYLFYEGEKYYFGEEYEFSDDEKDHHPDVAILIGFELHSDFKFETDNCNYKHIRKIDHTTKYKKLFLELKEQAEKDGVNLKEML